MVADDRPIKKIIVVDNNFGRRMSIFSNYTLKEIKYSERNSANPANPDIEHTVSTDEDLDDLLKYYTFSWYNENSKNQVRKTNNLKNIKTNPIIIKSVERRSEGLTKVVSLKSITLEYKGEELHLRTDKKFITSIVVIDTEFKRIILGHGKPNSRYILKEIYFVEGGNSVVAYNPLDENYSNYNTGVIKDLMHKKEGLEKKKGLEKNALAITINQFLDEYKDIIKALKNTNTLTKDIAKEKANENAKAKANANRKNEIHKRFAKEHFNLYQELYYKERTSTLVEELKKLESNKRNLNKKIKNQKNIQITNASPESKAKALSIGDNTQKLVNRLNSLNKNYKIKEESLKKLLNEIKLANIGTYEQYANFVKDFKQFQLVRANNLFLDNKNMENEEYMTELIKDYKAFKSSPETYKLTGRKTLFLVGPNLSELVSNKSPEEQFRMPNRFDNFAMVRAHDLKLTNEQKSNKNYKSTLIKQFKEFIKSPKEYTLPGKSIPLSFNITEYPIGSLVYWRTKDGIAKGKITAFSPRNNGKNSIHLNSVKVLQHGTNKSGVKQPYTKIFNESNAQKLRGDLVFPYPPIPYDNIPEDDFKSFIPKFRENNLKMAQSRMNKYNPRRT